MLIFSKRNEKISKSFYEHHESIAQCIENFEGFFEILFSENPDMDKLESAKAAVDRCEANADIGMRAVISLMGESFLPVTRKNLIALVQNTDEIANKCQEVVRQIMLEGTTLPQSLHQDIMVIIQITKSQLSILYTAIDKLLNDFKSIYKDRKILDDIGQEESHVDRIEGMLHKRIFDMDIPLYEKMYYRGKLELICDVSDIIEDIADQILVMLVEREA